MKQTAGTGTKRRYIALVELTLARLREFYREPEALFWVYGFPILMVVGLGIAFRNQPVEQIAVDVREGPYAEATVAVLEQQEKFQPRIVSPDEATLRLRTARSALVVTATGGETPAYEYTYDPTRPESELAKNAVDDALQRAAGRQDSAQVTVEQFDEPGGRYIDFLVPGLLGMSLMGGGLWGLGFVTVDMRIRKLLKRFVATPMRKSEFLAGLMLSRLLFLVPEVLVLLVFARLVFDVRIYGSLTAVVFLILLGAVTFAGLGLLVASRAKTLEAVSGLMNLVMLPMWLLSGIFFSSDRFPESVQPAIKLLPLTALNDALRAVMQEGVSLATQLPEVGLLLVYAVVTFALALKLFRWV